MDKLHKHKKCEIRRKAKKYRLMDNGDLYYVVKGIWCRSKTSILFPDSGFSSEKTKKSDQCRDIRSITWCNRFAELFRISCVCFPLHLDSTKCQSVAFLWPCAPCTFSRRFILGNFALISPVEMWSFACHKDATMGGKLWNFLLTLLSLNGLFWNQLCRSVWTQLEMVVRCNRESPPKPHMLAASCLSCVECKRSLMSFEFSSNFSKKKKKVFFRWEISGSLSSSNFKATCCTDDQRQFCLQKNIK